jgi:two-component system, cell cycle sensor histidine kinase and response regulator CckA
MAESSVQLPIQDTGPAPRAVTWSLGICGAALLFLLVCARWDLQPSGLHPHGYCFLWDPMLVGVYTVSDLLIWASYIAISATLLYLVRRARSILPFSWLFVAFGVFIVSCGMTHLLDVVTLWRTAFWVSADVRAITALASLATALALPQAVPSVLALLQSARVSEQRRFQLERAQLELEQRVQSRTADLAASEARYRRLLDAANEGVLTLDRHGVITYANARVAQVLGTTVEALVGKDAADLVDPTSPVHPVSADAQQEVGPVEVLLRAADGTQRWVLLTTRHTDSGTSDASTLVMITDETRRRALEDQLRQSQKLEAVGRLAGGVAHDFNNLITAMYGCCELIKPRLAAGDDSAHLYLEEMREASDRAADLTRQLLAFSRRQVLLPRVISLGAVVRNYERMLERVIGEDVQLAVRTATGNDSLHGDIGQMEQVLMNLVVNARDAMPDGGTLTIETRLVDVDDALFVSHPSVPPGRYVWLSVSDTGTGIAADALPHIFEPFFTTKGERGTGLGLATVYGIVKQSGGDLWVYSEPGLGTTIRALFPSVDATPAPAPSESPEGPVHGSERLLIVEDNESVREAMGAAMGNLGYTVLLAPTPAAALDMVAADGSIALMIADMVMPGMNGPQLERQMRQRCPELQTLFVSGYSDGGLFAAEIGDGDRHFLQKPFSPTALARKIRQILDQ